MRWSIVLVAALFACNTWGADIEDQVKETLQNLSEYTAFDYLEFNAFQDLRTNVHGTEVTLTGQVVNPALKDEAAKAVLGIDGVTAVLNEIEILPSSASDNAIRTAEYRAIFGDPGLRRYGNPLKPTIHIIVKNGEVRLEGLVAGEGDRETATASAESVPGVTRIDNNLLVEQGLSE